MDSSFTAGKPPHYPVLYKEIIHALRPKDRGFYVDGTLGAGGHAWGILEACSPEGRLLGLDLDPAALELARERLAPFGSRAFLVQASYTTLKAQLKHLGWTAVDGILLDFGISSMQLDTPERGFSFQQNAPLDMRFDPASQVTADMLVNDLPESELAEILFRYGEERQARKIARAVVMARPVTTTLQLAQIVAQAVGGKSGRGRQSRTDPATLTFQALRIAVNRELESIEAVLPVAVEVLKPGGKLAVISFHSLEDRLVKQFMRRESQDCICPPRAPICTCGHLASIKEITRRPVQPGEAEVQRNPRARSARLRVAEKLSSTTKRMA
jgi:16S rRNA (cytosine1402-N4)-methyltransferase